MGVTYSIDVDARIVRLTYAGETTNQELEAAVAAVLRDPSYQRGFGFLADRRNVEAPTTAYTQRAASAIVQQRERVGGARLAVVVSNPAGYGMARMGQILGEGGGMAIRVFKDIDQAEAWLRAPASTE